jgi:hypothetical protein
MSEHLLPITQARPDKISLLEDPEFTDPTIYKVDDIIEAAVAGQLIEQAIAVRLGADKTPSNNGYYYLNTSPATKPLFEAYTCITRPSELLVAISGLAIGEVIEAHWVLPLKASGQKRDAVQRTVNYSLKNMHVGRGDNRRKVMGLSRQTSSRTAIAPNPYLYALPDITSHAPTHVLETSNDRIFRSAWRQGRASGTRF